MEEERHVYCVTNRKKRRKQQLQIEKNSTTVYLGKINKNKKKWDIVLKDDTWASCFCLDSTLQVLQRKVGENFYGGLGDAFKRCCRCLLFWY